MKLKKGLTKIEFVVVLGLLTLLIYPKFVFADDWWFLQKFRVEQPVKVISVDASDPANTKVNYSVAANLTLDEVTFNAPGASEKKNNVSGVFNFSFNQFNLPKNKSTIQLSIVSKGRTYVVNVNAVRKEKRGPMEQELVLGKVFVDVNGVATWMTIPVVHQLFEVWHVVEYDVVIIGGSKTVWVGESVANIKIFDQPDLPTQPKIWIERHFYKDNSGSTYLEKDMNDDDSSQIIHQGGYNFASKLSNDNEFFIRNTGLTGFGQIFNLQMDDPNGPAPWVPLGNINVDKTLD